MLFEAVEQSSDAIQITGPDSCIMVSLDDSSERVFEVRSLFSDRLCTCTSFQFVNRAFADISGYSRDEVVGKPAMDILRTIDSKSVSFCFCYM